MSGKCQFIFLFCKKNVESFVQFLQENREYSQSATPLLTSELSACCHSPLPPARSAPP